MGIEFHATLDIGSILIFLGSLIAGAGVIYTLRANVRGLSDRLEAVEDEIKKLVAVLVTQARQDERLNAQATAMNQLREQVSELAHGRGFVDVAIKPAAARR